jgi:hypothetical protein
VNSNPFDVLAAHFQARAILVLLLIFNPLKLSARGGWRSVPVAVIISLKLCSLLLKNIQYGLPAVSASEVHGFTVDHVVAEDLLDAVFERRRPCHRLVFGYGLWMLVLEES